MEKIKKYPFVTWLMVLVTVALLAEIFGPENVWQIIAGWLAPPA